MCGIAGFINRKCSLEDNRILIKKMIDAIRYRGPDGDGFYTDENVSLGHCRLSIIDLKTGAQPLWSSNRRYCIITNGEMYNYREHRKKLIENNYQFTTSSDTEVILNLYIEYGVDCLKYIRGMFSFVIWDCVEKSVFIVRDRLGVKPLLYTYINNTLFFASELKSLLLIPEIKKNINLQAVNHYLSLQYIPSPLTIFNNIYKLKPANYIYFKNGNFEIKKYWQLSFKKDDTLDFHGWKERFLKTFTESAKLRMLSSDVPVGVFLSGGLDSTSTTAVLSREFSTPLKTYSLGFDNKNFNELTYARKVSEMYGTVHHEFEEKVDILKLLPVIINHINEPFADSAIIPRYIVSKVTRQHVKVALCGDGGDESAAGYHRYLWIKFCEYYDKLPKIVRKKLIFNVAKAIPSSIIGVGIFSKIKRFLTVLNFEKLDRYMRWISYFNKTEKNLLVNDKTILKYDAKLDNHFTSLFRLTDAENYLDEVLFVESNTYLPDDILFEGDISSMAVALEVRSAYMDHNMFELFASMPLKYKMPGFAKKSFIRNVFKGMLPEEIISKKKTGFSIPISEWLRKDLKEIVLETLIKSKYCSQYFDMTYVEKLIKSHLIGNADNGFKIWSLLIFELWHRNYLQNEKVL